MGAAEQGDEADEAFAGTLAGPEVPAHARAVAVGRGHRFAAYRQCWTDTEDDGGYGRWPIGGIWMVVKATSRINAGWHKGNRMPPRATLDQRVTWHLAHMKVCQCHPGLPATVLAELKRRGIAIPKQG